MITKTGKFHWNSLVAFLKKCDPKCAISGSTLDDNGICDEIIITSYPEKEPELETIINNHDATAELASETAAKIRIAVAAPAIRSIPNWATWTAQEAADWININVTDLPKAKQVLMNMAKMLCYLRDHGGIV